MPTTLAGKWLRRYRWIFLLIATFLFGQLILAYLLPKLTNGTADSHPHSGQRASVTTVPTSAVPKAAAAASSTAPAASSASPVTLTESVTVSAECTISAKEAVSAIHRARSTQCKQHIADVTCAIQAGEFYAHTLPNSCPNGSFIANRALGCFRDVKKARLLSGYYANFKQLNTPSKCIQLCLQSGFLYAGVQYGSECFCGNVEPPAAAKLNETEECGYACVGEPEQMCGGYFAVHVYETGISKFVPQVAELMPNGTDNSVKIAFLLTLNGRAVRQVHRLLKALYNPNHFYYIHVDKRQDYLYSQLLPLELHASNIRLARRRFSTIWGGASLLTMLLASMDDLRHISDWRWDFVINLSESDFPVKTVDRLADFLTANRDRNFVKSHGREVQRFIQKQGLDKTFVECDTHMWRTGDRTLPGGIQIDGGSDWVALSRDFVEYVSTPAAADRDPLVGGLLRIFEHTLLPAESFFHTALRNSRFCNTYVDNNLHVTNWKRKLGCKCQYKHVVDWCGCSPNDFKPDDWPRLLATDAKQVFFARKFEPVVNQAVILKLEAWMFGAQHGVDVVNMRSYWQNVHVWRDKGDESEPILRAVGESVVRLKLAEKLLKVVRISEMNIFMENDQHRGFLVRAHVTLTTAPEETVEIEVWARHEQLPQASRSLAVGKRILHLEVSSDFDQKEQIARNFVKILGPQSEPVLVMHFAESGATAAAAKVATYNCTCLWINPAGRLEDVSEMHVEESAHGYSVHFSKAKLSAPLVAGVWTVKVLHKRGVVGKCDFFVMPAAETDAKRLDEEVVERRTFADNEAWSAFVPGLEERVNQTEQAVREANLRGADRTRWVDSMVKRFMVLREMCFVSREAVADGEALCAETSWSSLAPDPKSDIYADLRGM